MNLQEQAASAKNCDWLFDLRRVSVFWVGLWLLLLVFGLIASGPGIDRSPLREFLYWLFFGILPVLAVVGSSHILACFITPGIAGWSFLAGIAAGFGGTVWLHYSISVSPDPVAVMAYIAMPVCFAVFSVPTFFLVALILFAAKKIRGRSRPA